MTALPEALDSARALALSVTGRRSSSEREARCSRSASSAWLRLFAGVDVLSAAAAPLIGSGCEKTPVETAIPVAATAIPDRTATLRRR